ncbi:PLP-dependent aminotransferase family protein [Shouchella sp. 1P09AA]|uniref:aminotransferase-like domain-containing protein n=1 Tax=unclassified Shouchella TaxID=2893065 RepID=UPI0039A32EA9
MKSTNERKVNPTNWKDVTSSMTNSHRIVTELKEKIISGEWPVYTKLPTQNELAQQYQVNRSTVVKAIDELKSYGYVTAVQGSGVYVSTELRKADLKQFLMNWDRLSQWSFYSSNKSLVKKINDHENHSNYIQLSKGVLGKEHIPETLIRKAMTNASTQPFDHDYGDGKGDIRFRKAISKHLEKRGIHVGTESIMVVSGALNGIQLIASSILQTGSQIYLDTHSFLNTLNFFHSLGIRTSPVSQYGNIHNLKDMKPNQAVYVNSPFQNPTTLSLHANEQDDILKYTHSKNIAIIEDNIYGDLVYEGNYPSLKSKDQAGNVIYLSSFSKTLSPALRIGWIVAKPEIIQKMSDVRMHTDYGTSNITQAICTELLASGDYDAHLSRLRIHLKEKRDYLDSLLKLHLSKFGSWHIPAGGFFIWFTFHEEWNLSIKKLFHACLKQNVLFNPGTIYGKDEQPSIRFSFAYETKENLKLGITILAETLDLFVQEGK